MDPFWFRKRYYKRSCRNECGLAIAAFGPGNSVSFTLTGATLSGGSNTVNVNNNDVSRSFIMPASGSVGWSATYVTPAGGGSGNIAVGAL